MGFEKKGSEYESEKRVGITPVKEEAEGLLHLGSSLLGMGTRYTNSRISLRHRNDHILPLQAIG